MGGKGERLSEVGWNEAGSQRGRVLDVNCGRSADVERALNAEIAVPQCAGSYAPDMRALHTRRAS